MKNVAYTVSLTLKQLRQTMGWSLAIASQKTGVSKAMLGQIERGESSPTVATLWKIATGFNVPFSFFVENIEATTGSFEYQVPTDPLFQKNSGMCVTPIFPFNARIGFEMFMIKLNPNSEHLSLPHQKGVIEHVVVVSGQLAIMVDNEWRTLHLHQGCRFDADKAHGYRNVTNEPVIFHDIIHYPVKGLKNMM